MDTEHLDRHPRTPAWLILLISVAALVVATAALTAIIVRPTMPWSGSMMSGLAPGSVTGQGMMGGSSVANGAQPGEAGFVAGTVAAPRIVRITAGPGYAFTPSTVTVVRGETVTFVVRVMGAAVHEFMVGPADAVAADAPGTPETAGIAMMQSKSLTYTFDGSGPYAFACHADGPYEAGMHGTITLVS